MAVWNALRDRFEAERDRWVLWVPVGLAAGIGLYFALPVEPPLWLAAAPLLGVALCLAWRGRAGWPLAAAILVICAGFALALIRGHAVAAPILRQATGPFWLGGQVESIEPVEGGQRVILSHLSGGPLDPLHLARIRVRLRDGDPVRPGQMIRIRASLSPPPMPAAPGAYDFARNAWFQRIGAVGYASGHAEIVVESRADGPLDRARLLVERARQAVAARIAASIAGYPPEIGMVAAALITGQRGPVPPEILQSYRDAGLAHILVIAGMHMSMVAGLVLVALRALLALIPAVALRYPIHKWTAWGALLVTLGYLLISGAPVPTQRAFVMNAVVLLAILIDRQAVSMRSIALAATLILAWQPEALVSASFQLSFAAVYGLIAGYEALGSRLARWHQSAPSWWQVPLLYAAGILLTTQIAGTATAFYSLYHFNRYALYSLLGNFLAVPLVGFWVMPAALLAFCLMPFGLDAWGWQAMAAGLSLVGKIASWVSGLPGATVSVPAMPALASIVFSSGAAWLILWRRSWRLGGLAVMAAGLWIAAVTKAPDLMIDESGKVVALREADGLLHVSAGHNEAALRRSWAQLAGEGEEMSDFSADSAVSCDDDGCLVRVAENQRSLAVDRRDWRGKGTHFLWFRDGQSPEIESTADWQGDRLWSSGYVKK